MADVVGYELQARRERGGWETVRHFAIGEQAEARAAFERARHEGAAALRLIEERVDQDGLFHSRTLGLRTA
ncbi:MAG TPA: hypothetical protein VIR38_08255, partial [Thalassobaculum sp.]